jgi:hypothetical protein
MSAISSRPAIWHHNNARLTFRLRRLLSRRPLSSESGSVGLGHTRCRHQSYAADGLDCRAVASLCMAEVALGADTWPDHGGGGGSAVLAIVTLPTRLPRGRDAGRPRPGQVVRQWVFRPLRGSRRDLSSSSCRIRSLRTRPMEGSGDDDPASAFLILASGIDPNLAAPATAWCSRATIRSLMIRPSEGGQEGRRIRVVSCDWSLGWRHADRDQFGPRIRLR